MSLEPTRILVVDDDEDVREICVRMLAMEGYHVETASSAEEVVEKIDLSRYNLTLTDIRMPGQDGLSLVRWIRKLNPNMGIIVITGYPSIDSTIQALRSGVCDFLVKPFSLEEIKLVVGKCLEKQRLAQDLARTNAALTKVNQELERTNYLQTQFLSIVSHEMRTPLNVVLQLTRLLLEKKIPKSQIDETLSGIQEESIRMKKLLATLYDFSRLRAGKVNLNPEPLNLRKVITGYLELLASQLAGWKIIVLIQDDLPPVLADRDRLIQIITNLLSNAVKYSTPGSRIIIRAFKQKIKKDREQVRVSIRDYGTGIPKDELPFIFETFYRGQLDHPPASITGEDVVGLGLGLSIVKAIVQLMGGEIYGDSVVGKGSKFTFTLPVAAGTLKNKKESEPGVDLISKVS